jgi:polyhydroxyalkanoate synthesis regulator phasin
MAMADLDDLTERLERLAAQLRAGELAPAEAAELVDECARTAGEAAAELDRQARASTPPGQTELL